MVIEKLIFWFLKSDIFLKVSLFQFTHRIFSNFIVIIILVRTILPILYTSFGVLLCLCPSYPDGCRSTTGQVSPCLCRQARCFFPGQIPRLSSQYIAVTFGLIFWTIVSLETPAQHIYEPLLVSGIGMEELLFESDFHAL